MAKSETSTNFCCIVQVLNFKVTCSLWRQRNRRPHYGYCFVSISCYSYATFPEQHNAAASHFLWFFCLPPEWPRKECDVAAESTWVLTRRWLPAPHSLQHAPGETGLTPDPSPCLSHRNAQLHDSEPRPNGPSTESYRKETQVWNAALCPYLGTKVPLRGDHLEVNCVPLTEQKPTLVTQTWSLICAWTY